MQQVARRTENQFRHTATILGCACRLPGAPDESSFWSLLDSARCSVSEIPRDRWSHEHFFHPNRGIPGRSYTFAAGVLDDITSFDPGVFGLSPREAEQIDPQQRLLLELVREALEDANIPIDRLYGERVGVFVGASSLDNSIHFAADIAAADSHFVTGNAMSIIANRISHVFGFTGPSLTIDTACSSSLVAFDRAVKAIEAGEIDTAVVAGVNILSSPFYFVGFSRAGMLSPTGLCRPFSGEADGYVRAEGGVVTVLGQFDRAKAAGHTPRAVIRASGTNSDGRTVGIAMPSGLAQQRLLDELYDERRIDPSDLAFIEAHGTGTSIGDPIEAQAIGVALGQKRSKPLLIGSVKSNIGHLEPASGLAGLLKALNALERGRLPASLHLDTLNIGINFQELNLMPAVEAHDLRNGARSAGISSFGFGGTNAHAVIRLPEPDEFAIPLQSTAKVLMISANDVQGLATLANQYADRLEATPEAAAQLAYAAAHGRARLPYRFAVGLSEPNVVDKLRHTAANNSIRSVSSALLNVKPNRFAFVFGGNGAQFSGMGHVAWQTSATFQSAVEQIDNYFMPLASWSLGEAFMNPPNAEHLADTEIAQPLIFALEVALARSLMADGCSPSVVFGHSVGEIAAAHIAGILSLKDAVHLIYTRSHLQAQLRGQGTMAFLLVDAKSAQDLITTSAQNEIVIAAVNAPNGVTLAGPATAISNFLRYARRQGVVSKRLDIEYPFHSPAVDSLKTPILAELATITPLSGDIPFISTVTGEVTEGTRLNAEYWWRNIREPVRFESAIRVAADLQTALYIEIGPRPVLTGFLRETLAEAEQSATILPSFQRNDAPNVDPVKRTMLSMLTHGVQFDESTLFDTPGPLGRPNLPHTPWNRQKITTRHTTESIDLLGQSTRPHPLLGLRLSDSSREWRGLIDMDRLPFLADHKVGDTVLMPATALIEMLLAAGRETLGVDFVQLEGFSILGATRLEHGESIETLVRMDDEGFATLSARARGTNEWSLRARGRLLRAEGLSPHDPAVDEKGIPVTTEDLYAAAAQLGLHYGPAFRLVKVARRQGTRIVLEFLPVATSNEWILSPTYADAALHGLVLAAQPNIHKKGYTFVPIRIERLIVRAGGVPIHAVLDVRRVTKRSMLLDVDILDQDGIPIARMEGVRLQALHLELETELESDFEQISVPLGNAVSDVGERIQAAIDFAPLNTATDDTLLLDACAYAIAHRAVTKVVGLVGEGLQPVDVPSLVQQGRLAPEKTTQFVDLLQLLKQGALAYLSPTDEWSVAVNSDLPSPEALLTDILACSPDRAVEVTLAARLAADLPFSLSENNSITHPSALVDLWETSSPSAQEIRHAITHLTSSIHQEGQPVPTVLIVERHGVLLEALSSLAENGQLRIFVCPSDPKGRLRLADRLSGSRMIRFVSDEDEDVPPVDLVVSLATNAPNNTATFKIKPGGGILSLRPARMGFAALLTAGATWPTPLGRRLNGIRGSVDVAFQLVDNTDKGPIGDVGAALHRLLESDTTTLLVTAADIHSKPGFATLASSKITGILIHRLASAGTANEIATTLDKARCLLETARSSSEPPSIRFLIDGNPLGTDPQAGALWAFGRVAINEYPDLDIRLLALAERQIKADVMLERAIIGVADEREIIIFKDALKGVRVLPRMPIASAADDSSCARLVIEHPGRLDRLTWRNVPRRAPSPGEVEIGITASALNFRDVMFAQGLIGDDMLENGFAGPSLGFECAGTVLRVGDGVATLKPGDVVAAYSPNALASHITVNAGSAMAVPIGINPEAAATLLVAFLTAWYGLVHCARLSPGETVLIHGAAGGVGLAALQIARTRGARIVATAGSPEKRELVRLLGADSVYNSREVTFADMLIQEGGCDVVLNSLAGRAMEESFRVLKPFGRFIELGKRDFIADSRLGLRPFARNLTYFGVDADQLIAAQPMLIREILETLHNQFATGLLTPLPYEILPADDVRGAFRLMQSSGHVGKILIRPPTPQTPPPPLPSSFEASEHGVHLVVGGGTGFGRAAVEWLARSGARCIAVASRRGHIDPPLNIDGVIIEMISCDVRDIHECTALIEKLRQRHGRIAGIIHAAMVLDDSLISDTNADRLTAVLSPKVDGANNLDAVTSDLDLNYFVLFSSATTLVGNPGQAAYVTANAYLEGLARRRRAQGRPALAMAWGAISDVGVLASDNNAAEILRHRLGLRMLTARDALDYLGTCLAGTENDPVRSYAPINWKRASELAVMRGATFAFLRPIIDDAETIAGHTNIALLIAGENDRKAKATLVQILSVELGRILRLPVNSIDTTKALTDLGVDSLMALELEMEMQSRYNLALPMLGLGAGVTLLDVADKLLRKLRSVTTDENKQNLMNEGSALIDSHLGSGIATAALEDLQRQVTKVRPQPTGRSM